MLGLLNDGDARGHLTREDIHAPHLVDSEIAHALRAQVHRGRVSAREANRAIERWQRLGLRRYPAVGLLPRVWELRDNISAYDATYVALAEALGCSVVTADARLARARGVNCPVLTVRT